MAEEYTQGTRPMTVSTPLGPDKLLLVGFEGTEQISGLFSFRLDLIAPNSTKVEFGKLLGQEFVVTMQIQNEDPQSTEAKVRYFRGICRRFEQGNRDQEFTTYRAEIVPPLWVTTRTAQCRIFQQVSVPDILKKVLTGLQVDYQLDGAFEKREYCVQYRETDFNFACRLMEEEGIFYFFKHAKDKLEMVVGNSARVHPDVDGVKKVHWNVEEGKHREMRHIHEWVKRQEMRSGKYALWDHSFQRPDDNFESKKNTLGSVAVGKVTHKLETGGNEKFEIYDFPGEFAQRFDGIAKGGGEQAGEPGKISPDGARTVELRMQAETVAGLVVEGSSNCNQFTSGHKFTLEKHFDAEGRYILTSVHHIAHGGNAYRSGEGSEFVYSNSFTCIPDGLPFRPQRVTPKPCVMGAQTALVVGPSGEEIFTDKYGRVKVQFFWDRASAADANSSCWLRVGTPWAGKQWGAIHIPRIGHEVIVQFLEGDPDAPIIIGSVYNANTMPPYTLPDEKTKSGIKSNSSIGSGGFNEIRFEDKKGSEQVFLHAEKDQDIQVKNDRKETIGNDRHLHVKNNKHEKVDADRHETVSGSHFEEVTTDRNVTVGGKEAVKITASQSVGVGGDMVVEIKGDMSQKVSGKIYISASGDLVIESSSNITLKVGGSSIAIDASGVGIAGPQIKSAAGAVNTISGATVKIN
jgi:type VI secretion system secreted protein VgrG